MLAPSVIQILDNIQKYKIQSKFGATETAKNAMFNEKTAKIMWFDDKKKNSKIY